jgi:hypothetical protein
VGCQGMVGGVRERYDINGLKSSRESTAAVIEVMKHGLLIDRSTHMDGLDVQLLTERRGGVGCFVDPAMMMVKTNFH